MCGIVGIWNLDGPPIDEPMLSSFTDSLAHGGPDGRGTFVDSRAGLGLGHRRLAILDLSLGGHQPMAFGDGCYRLAHNGEIYNFLELREELEALGHCFTTESDTEVILASQSEIWDGPSVRDVVECSCANGDYDTASQGWKFIQAMLLLQLFQSKASA